MIKLRMELNYDITNKQYVASFARPLTTNTSAVLSSGQDDKTLETVAKVYELVVHAGVHRASSIRVAEAGLARFSLLSAGSGAILCVVFAGLATLGTTGDSSGTIEGQRTGRMSNTGRFWYYYATLVGCTCCRPGSP